MPTDLQSVPPSPLIEQTIGQHWPLGNVTIQVLNAPVSQIITEAANQLGVSVLVPQQATEQTMTATYTDAPGQRVIEDIGDYLELVPEYDGSTIRFLDEDQATREFVVIRSGYKPATELVEDLSGLLNNTAKVKAMDDRVVVTGTRRDLEQVQRFRKHLETGPDGWMLNIRIVAITESFRRDLGLDWNLTARLGLDTTNPGSIVTSDALVSVIAEATETNLSAYLADHATMYLLEGSESNITQGRKVPVPRFSTSPEGTTTVVGYDYIDAGFQFRAKAERVPIGVRLQLEPSISTVTGFVREAPITEESTVQVDAIVRDGEWIIITGLSVEQASSDYSGIPGLSKAFGTESRLDDKATLLVMVQARRIFGSQPDER